MAESGVCTSYLVVVVVVVVVVVCASDGSRVAVVGGALLTHAIGRGERWCRRARLAHHRGGLEASLALTLRHVRATTAQHVDHAVQVRHVLERVREPSINEQILLKKSHTKIMNYLSDWDKKRVKCVSEVFLFTYEKIHAFHGYHGDEGLKALGVQVGLVVV